MASNPIRIWTALPNGFDASGFPKLSIYVSLRFDDPAGKKLSDFTLGNWPEEVASLIMMQQLRLQVGSGVDATDVAVGVDPALLQPALWTALFPGTALVRPFAFQDHSKRALRSYSVRAIHDYIEGVYTNVANDSPADFPDLLGANDASNLVQAVTSVMDGVRRQASATKAPRGFIPPMPPNLAGGQRGTHPDASIEKQMQTRAEDVASGIPGAELYRAYRFYNRGQQEKYRSGAVPRVLADIPPPVAPPKFDVHQVIAALGDHPAILRRLGLVIDCTLSSRVPAGSTQIRVAVGDPAGGPPMPGDKTPWTLLDPDSSDFRAKPSATTDTVGGFLQLGNEQLFGLIQSDVDGAALRTIDYGVNMVRMLDELATRKQAACDVTGIAVPVETASAPQSLPALRTTGISVFRTDRDKAVYDKLTTAAGNNGDPGTAVLSLDDVTRGYRVDVGHKGKWFSLCKRVPSYAIDTLKITPGEDEGYVKAASGTSTAKAPPSGPSVPDLYLHEVLFGWDNWSLVVARPGRSLSIDRDDTDRTQTEIVRPEPNAPNSDFPIEISASVPKKTLPPLRFGRDYTLRARVVDLAGNSLPPTATVPAVVNGAVSPTLTYRRYEPVAPPALVLRAPVSAGESIERLVIRTKQGADPIDDETDIFNAACERHVSPPKTSQFMAELHGAFDDLFPNAAKVYAVAVKEKGTWQDPGGDVELIDASGASVDASPLDKRGEPLPDGHYVIHTSDAPALPYLPDPMAQGAVLQAAGGFVSVDYDVGAGGWPELSTFRLTLGSAASGGVEIEAKDGLQVRLPKGTMLTLKYSSTIDEANLPQFARWNAMNAAGRTKAKDNGLQHWMLTPSRELAFVHAVEKPMEEPVVRELTVARSLGETFVTLEGQVTSHAQSTGRIDLLAAWTDVVDRLSDTKPTMDARKGRVFERDIGYDETSMKIPAPCDVTRHEFGDTKHRWVSYHALGTTRYREYFPTLASSPELLSLAGPDTELVNIPNAARPDIPNILYVIPTFAWSRSKDGKKSMRKGRGLRVYVDRTWYSTGEDELLGVIVPPSGKISSALRKYVSQWGSDPVWDTSGPSTELGPTDFVAEGSAPGSTPTVVESLSLAEVDPSMAGMLVTAVGIAPEYNEERQLYAFDLVLDPGDSYYPFVRLVLARLQPYSLDGAHLSRTVRADFAQLVADRLATITYRDSAVDVSVSGLMPTSDVEAKTRAPARTGLFPFAEGGFNENDEAGKGRLVSAYVEQRRNKKLGDLGWETLGEVVYLRTFTLGKTPEQVYFRGSLPLPKSFGDGAEYRLAVEEHEIFETDQVLRDVGLPIDAPIEKAYRTRLVYFDTLPLEK
jgi:hypothetical protein